MERFQSVTTSSGFNYLAQQCPQCNIWGMAGKGEGKCFGENGGKRLCDKCRKEDRK